MSRQTIVILLTVLLSSSLFTLSGTVCSASENQSSQLTQEVKTIDSLTLRNRKMNSSLVVRVTYSVATAAPCPLIIFSHGAGGSKDAYKYVIDYWAAHGYVCIQPNHRDAIDLSKGRSNLALSMIKLGKELPSDYQLWRSRFADISCIIDSLPIVQQQIPTRIDGNEIAVGGHSLGAFTTAVIGGAKVPAASNITGQADPRVKALIMMSPQGVRHSDKDFGFDDRQSWTNISLPSLFLTGTRDTTGWSQPSDRRQPFDGSPPGNKFFALIDGASHMTFAGVDPKHSAERPAMMQGPMRELMLKRMQEKMPPETGNHEAMLRDIQAVTTDFLDSYLKGNRAEQHELCQPNQFGPLVSIECK